MNEINHVPFHEVTYKGTAYQEGKFIDITEEDFKGKYNVFFFYPADFTFVCPTELVDLQDQLEELKKHNVNVYGISADTHFVHKAWADVSEKIKQVTYPLIGDSNHVLSKNVFNILDETTGLANRATIVTNPKGEIIIVEKTADGVGRNAEELVRKIKAYIWTQEHPGEACPAKWSEGAETLKPSLDLVGKI